MSPNVTCTVGAGRGDGEGGAHAFAVVLGEVADDVVVAGGHVLDGEGAGVAGFEVGVAGLADVGVFADFVGAGGDGGGWVAAVGDGELVEGDVGFEDDGFVVDGAGVVDDEA